VPHANPRQEDQAVVAAAQAGDTTAFASLVERYRRELRVHCYRMLGSFEEAEDMVQETFLRAWRKRATYAGRSTFRAWLYRIATNACLDFLARHPRGPRGRSGGRAHDPGATPAEISWLQPYPDQLLEPAAPEDTEPDAMVVARETIELAFLVAIQHLPPRQRAVLIMRDVLGWPASETAALLDMSVAAVKSALQRARPAVKQHLPEHRTQWASSSAPTEEERALVQRFVDATERADMTTLASLLREDARQTMPPDPVRFDGRDAMIAMWSSAMVGPEAWGDWRAVITRANRQPAIANYFRPPDAKIYQASNLDVLRIEDGLVAEVTTFDTSLFPVFGLPLTL
jgi:RNA polymerase sigma-70 factor (ECF subfamily)